MMLSHPVLLGLLWSLLILSLSGQALVSSQETNKVYAYSYHFQHNGTTNSRDILRTFLGVDPDSDNSDTPAGPSIVKTFSSPDIRGFFTKGILPAGPINFNSGFGNRYDTNSAIDNIKKVVESNLQPPNIGNGLLPPVSPDISSAFPGDFNNVNDIGINFQKQNDFPKIPPPPPPFHDRDDYPNVPSAPRIPPINLNDFPKIPDPIINNNGISRIENFSRNTPDGGKVEGKIETFSYNPPPVTNSNSNYQENSQGFRRNENFVNSNREITGHRTQSYFKQQFRTITPNIESNSLFQNKRIDNSHNNGGNGNNNQWWNVLNVLGGNNNNNARNNVNAEHKNVNNEVNLGHNNVLNNGNLGRQIERNINEVKNNLNNELKREFGSRLSNFNNRQNPQANYNGNRVPRQNLNNGPNLNLNLNHNNRNNAFRNQQNLNNPFSSRIDSNQVNNNNPNLNSWSNNLNPINGLNNPNNNHQGNFNNQQHNNKNLLNNAFDNQNNQFKNDDTAKKVLNIINDVNVQLNNFDGGGRNKNLRLTWDDDIPQNFNNDWSRRQSSGNGRPFSNAHSGPLINQAGPKPVEMLKTSLDALVGGRELPAGNQGGNYRNVGSGGIEKFFNMDRVVEGPNSYSRNQRRGFERNFHVNSNSGYERNNNWKSNNLRRLDAQDSRDAFSKDFIDVFRDDY